MCIKDADRMANSIDSDQTAFQEQSDLCLHCLPRSVFPNHFGILFLCGVVYLSDTQGCSRKKNWGSLMALLF